MSCWRCTTRRSRRCSATCVGGAGRAEELTAETFLAAVESIERGAVGRVSVAWLVGIARHKLVDHWRTAEREDRRIRAVAAATQESDDPWDQVLDRQQAHDTLTGLTPMHRLVLTLRYVDGLPVGLVADHVGCSISRRFYSELLG